MCHSLVDCTIKTVECLERRLLYLSLDRVPYSFTLKYKKKDLLKIHIFKLQRFIVHDKKNSLSCRGWEACASMTYSRRREYPLYIPLKSYTSGHPTHSKDICIHQWMTKGTWPIPYLFNIWRPHWSQNLLSCARWSARPGFLGKVNTPQPVKAKPCLKYILIFWDLQ